MEARTIKLTLDNAREWYNKGGELKEIALQVYNEDELNVHTYEEICEELFNKTFFFIDVDSKVREACKCNSFEKYQLNNGVSEQQLRKLLALNKLVNVAKFLNEGWEPDWSNPREYKWYIAYFYKTKELAFDCNTEVPESCVYFKSKELALKAVEILGEETVKLAIASNW